jgi:hypothetical protein
VLIKYKKVYKLQLFSFRLLKKLQVHFFLLYFGIPQLILQIERKPQGSSFCQGSQIPCGENNELMGGGGGGGMWQQASSLQLPF